MMRKLLVLAFVGLSIGAFGQGKNGKNNDCDDSNCFSTEILEIKEIADGCFAYTVKVSAGGDCAHALSHYSVGIPSCATVSDISNSEGWVISTGTDPTSGISGFKVDDISGFGETSGSFIVTYTICDNGCADTINTSCYAPEVAYKAATCVFVEQVDYSCVTLEATLETMDAACGAPSGSARVIISDGVEPFSYVWSTGVTDSAIDNLMPGDYSVQVSDATGSTVELTATIAGTDPILITLESANSTCSGTLDGSIVALVTGGSGSLSYEWNTGATVSSLEGLDAGIYTVTVTDEAGCSATASTTVSNGSVITITGEVSKSACQQANGTITASATGGAEPYTYTWSEGATGSVLNELAPGLYTVTVADANGCSASRSFLVTEDNPLSINVESTKTGCVEDASGSINITVNGGSGNYQYEWNTGATSEDLANLEAGTYTLVVTDETGCTATRTVVIEARVFTLAFDRINVSCGGTEDGSVTVLASGGIEPYTYQWSTGSTSATINGLSQGFYNVQVIDGSGCMVSGSVLISNTQGISANFDITNADCSENGYSIQSNVSGGNGIYTYSWNTGDNSPGLSGLTTGDYSVTIEDTAGCSNDFTVTITADSTGCESGDNPDTGDGGSDDNPDTGDGGTNDNPDTGDGSTDDNPDTGDGGSDDNPDTGDGGADDNPDTGDGSTDDNPDTGDGGDDDNPDTGDGGTGDGSTGDDGSSDNPDTGDDTGDSDDLVCENPYDTEIELVEVIDDCYTYKATVSYSGVHVRGLSHWTIGVDCGNIIQVDGPSGFPVEYGTDPTTDLTGFKVDDIDGFGEGSEPESFEVYFTICTTDIDCANDLTDDRFEVAYKYGQCVSYQSEAVIDLVSTAINTTAYPNPFSETATIVVESGEDTHATVEILDRQGQMLIKLFDGYINAGQSEHLIFEGYELPSDIYTYKVTTAAGVTYGRLVLMK